MEEQIAIFCDTDDFCKAYEEYCRNKLLMDKKRSYTQNKNVIERDYDNIDNVSIIGL